MSFHGLLRGELYYLLPLLFPTSEVYHNSDEKFITCVCFHMPLSQFLQSRHKRLLLILQTDISVLYCLKTFWDAYTGLLFHGK
jgi:hypothetical protein